jgi:hypothetical protein
VTKDPESAIGFCIFIAAVAGMFGVLWLVSPDPEPIEGGLKSYIDESTWKWTDTPSDYETFSPESGECIMIRVCTPPTKEES